VTRFPAEGAALELRCTLPPGSDGVYEILKPGGEVMTQEELIAYLAARPGPTGPDAVWHFIQQVAGSPAPRDDFSCSRFVSREGQGGAAVRRSSVQRLVRALPVIGTKRT
jgi:hypothetical protein